MSAQPRAPAPPYAKLATAASDPTGRSSGTSPKWAKTREAWEEAAREFHAAVAAAYPADFAETLDLARAGDAQALDRLLDFLEADPMFFRSGYVKAQVARIAKTAILTPRQLQRVERIVLNLVDRRASQEFRHYCRLAFRVDSAALRAALREKSEVVDLKVARRAAWMLAYLEMRQPEPRR